LSTAPQKSDLPFGSEFSPSQIDLPALLELVEQASGDWHLLEASILRAFFSKHAKGDGGEAATYNRGKLANNCKLGLIAYGIIDRNGTFTEFGRSLYGVRGDPAHLYDRLAAHILLNLKGMALVRCIQEMTVAGERVTLDTLRLGLEERGVHFPKGGKHPSMMRLWLEKAGVFAADSWRVNEARLRGILGTDSAEFATLSRFTVEQRAFLLALANSDVAEPQPANVIRDLATAIYGVRFPDKNLPQVVLNALREAGYITFEKTTSGRGAKPPLVSPTAKLRSEIVQPLLDQLKNQVDPKLIDLLTKPLPDILAGLGADDRYVAGLALEALAFKLMRILGMDYVATRLRNIPTTGGAEIDLIFHSSRLVFSRWQVQCKNTARVSLDDVAKEVGLTHFLKSNVIVMVSTGAIGDDARRFANKIMQDSNLCVVMIDRSDLEEIKVHPPCIVNAFKREAHNAMSLKQIHL
jgi:site-specific DNA-methyltransferase (cytosine-N4-specific)